ncbi:MAG: sensor domain-containing diguanylate cyclase [Pseudomonadota bacterium]
MTALVAAACVLVAAVALDIAYREMRESTGRQQYAMLASAAAHLESELDTRRILLRTLAEALAAQPERASLHEVLARHPGLRSAFADLALIDAEGHVLASQRGGRLEGARFAAATCLQKTLREGRGLVSEPVADRETGGAVVLMTESALDASGRIAFLLCAGIDLRDSPFFAQAARLRPDATGHLFAFTRGGVNLHHRDRSRLLGSVEDEAVLQGSVRSALRGWEGWAEGEDRDGAQALVTYKQVRGVDWVLGSVFPAHEAFAGIAKARRYAWLCAAGIALLAGAIGWATMLVLLKPLRALRRHVHAVEREEAGIEVLDLSREDEIGALGRAFHSLSLKRQLAEQQLKELCLTDPLTGLGNRRQFDHDVALLAGQAARYRFGMAIAFLDVDCFKAINDSYGHAAGDAVLREFGRRLRGLTRPTDRSYRLAGDEFVIVSERLETAENARRFAGKILRAIRRPFDFEGEPLLVTTSIGIAVSRFPVPAVGDLLQHADAALYRTKRAGRDGYTVKELSTPQAASSTEVALRYRPAVQ